MTLRSDSKYPIHLTYVVKLSSDATPDALCGRLENLVSGKHGEFTSASELLRLMTAALDTGDGSPLDGERPTLS
ncbi:MAG: hypothetical protein CVU34_17820 [Betaproteobacteria bacterium HGW-Betaproteobacteria-7]|nr:MAG: hypothetical protein CVU34_17820 [Betaproteobacteria bacterium HGW-Betaproteobacteria-7]